MPQWKPFMLIGLSVGLFCVHAGRSQETSSPRSQRTMATERPKLAFLVGRFAASSRVPPPPSKTTGMTGKGTSAISWTLDSMFLSIDDKSSLFGHYEAHGMLGFNQQSGHFELTMFNNFGDRPTYNGDFSGDTLVLQAKIPSPRGSFDQKILWYKEGGGVSMKILNDYGKGYATVIEQTATPEGPR